jgi:hypothetical protein
MALADSFMVSPEGSTTTNNGMNVGVGARLSSAPAGLAAHLTGKYVGSVDGLNQSYDAFDRLRPETKEGSVGVSLPVGGGSLALSRDVREMPAYGVVSNSNNVTVSDRDGNYGGAYFGDDGYKGAYAGYQINPKTSVNGNVSMDPYNKVTNALLQLRRTF